MCNTEDLIAYLYGEVDEERRRAVEAHLTTCVDCRADAEGLRATRQQLQAWAPPAPALDFQVVRTAPPAAAPPRRRPLAFIPEWALGAAAALLLIAGAAALANLDVRVGPEGVTVRTGWLNGPVTAPSSGPVAAPAPVPVADATPAVAAAGASESLSRRLDALEEQLRAMEAQQATRLASASEAPRPGITASELRKVLEESELRQRTELAMQVSQLWKDFYSLRSTDMARVQDVVSRAQGLTNQQLRQHRDSIETLYRTASQR